MNTNTNIKDSFWDLLAKYITGEANEEEKTIIESWIGESEVNLREFEECKKLMEKAGLYFKTNHYNEERAWAKVRAKTGMTVPIRPKQGKNGGKKVYFPILKYAAAAVLAITLGTAGYYLGFRNPSVNDLIVLTGNLEQKEVTLPDGTLVALNANTRVTYPEQFTGKTREVEIEGEAFFNVKPNPERPFIITAGNTQIKVLGTSFNVYAYPGSETVEVVVETGKVQVVSKTDSQNQPSEVFLDPGEKATLAKKNKTLQKKVNDDPNFVAWKTHDFVFEKSSLAYVLQTLEKSFQVEIVVSDQKIEELVYTAQFNDKSVDFILEVIRLTFNLELSVEKGRYFLTSRKP